MVISLQAAFLRTGESRAHKALEELEGEHQLLSDGFRGHPP